MSEPSAPATLEQHIAAAFARFDPQRPAIACDEVSLSFGELGAMVDGFAGGLNDQGIGPGSVVGYSLPNCPEALALLLAVSRVGAAAVPLFPMIPAPMRAGLFAALRCSLVLTAGPTSAALSEAAGKMPQPLRVLDMARFPSRPGAALASPTVRPEQPLLAAASSGTTDAPKSVWITQANAAAVVTASADLARLGSWRNDPSFSSMMAFPLSTSGALVVLGMLCAGTRLIFSRETSPVRFAQLAAHYAADSLSAPPSFFEALLGLPDELTRPLTSVRGVFTGMDFLSPSLLARLAGRFPSLDRAASGYGLIETSTVFMTWKAHTRAEMQAPAHGFALCPGVDNTIEIRDLDGKKVLTGEGELWVRGPSVVSGYMGGSTENAESFRDGWFRTGDLARWLPDGTVELCGRRKYLIKRGGKSVSPVEVGDRVEACPGVRACAVVGVSQPLYGQMIWAFVVLDRERPAQLKDIMKVCRATLPNYMVPDRVTFIDELPRGSGVGKIDRETLIRMATRELETEQGVTRA